MSNPLPFRPHYGTTQSIAAAATSATANLNKDDKVVRVYNTGANIAFVRTLNSSEAATQAATVADMPVGAGQVIYIEKGMDHDRLNHISALTTTLLVTTGEGGVGAGNA